MTEAPDEVADLVPDEVPHALPWRVATLVHRRQETPTAATLELDVPGWRGALAGQHVDVRLTAEDGYSAQRSYSLASPASMGLPVAGAGTPRIALTVQVVDDGEVSPYLTDDLGIGDQIELRGPIGSWFVWHATDPRPVQLVAGGSGLVPLMSIARTHAACGSSAPLRLLVSVRSPQDALYSEELDLLAPGVQVTRVWTRSGPPAWSGPVGRIDADLLRATCLPPDQSPRVYVCGPTAFVEAVADALVDLGHDPELIRTERFGPTGT
ncbi:ferredoxin reductase [Cellulomonas edaphi]|uniref:Ferredoxin reductase n=1 Tax=Cellulomonas edaphi TaxID=3053468 RepID=A0ABT7S7I8_9CELL|nr:ferredoxin reductase [Cellulomons edaphi]MDM7831584.1 ferredoxin reductase [Cellulomons edaphi]